MRFSGSSTCASNAKSCQCDTTFFTSDITASGLQQLINLATSIKSSVTNCSRLWLILRVCHAFFLAPSDSTYVSIPYFYFSYHLYAINSLTLIHSFLLFDERLRCFSCSFNISSGLIVCDIFMASNKYNKSKTRKTQIILFRFILLPRSISNIVGLLSPAAIPNSSWDIFFAILWCLINLPNKRANLSSLIEV